MEFAGRLHGSGLFIAGAISLSILVVVAWLEWRVTRSHWKVTLIYLLRAIAVAVVLWMLSEPSQVLKTQSSRSKKVAVLMDVSSSMGVTDLFSNNGPVPHWAAREGSEASTEKLRAYDRAFTSMALCNASKDSPAIALRHAEAAAKYLKSISGYDPTASRLEAELHSMLPMLRRIRETAATMVVDGSRDLETATTRQMIEQIQTAIGGEADAAARQVAPGTKLESRLSLAADAGHSFVDRLSSKESGAQIVASNFASRVEPVDPASWGRNLEAQGDSTDISAALRSVADDPADLAAVVLFSDGGHNAPSDPVTIASGFGATPLFIVPCGNTEFARDLIVHRGRAPRMVFKEDDYIISANIDAYGCDREELIVSLVENGTVIDSQRVLAATDTFFHKVEFKRKASGVGHHDFLIEVAPVAEERVTANNSTPVGLDVVEDNLRVLLVDVRPRWEHRFLRNLFKRDERVRIDEVLFDPAAGALPATDADWNKYQIVILGDVSPRELPAAFQTALDRFVGERGGALITIAGDAAMPFAFRGQPLEPMLPVDLTRSRPLAAGGYRIGVAPEGTTIDALQLDENSAETDRVWAGACLPQGITNLSPFSVPLPTSRVLLAAVPLGSEKAAAFLSAQLYGRGRVLYFAAPSTYRLRYRNGDLFHHRFWGQLLRWAISGDFGSGSRTVRLSTDKARYQVGQFVRAKLMLTNLDGTAASELGGEIVARQQDQIVASAPIEEVKESPGSYEAVLKGLPQGLVSIEAVGGAVQALLATERAKEKPMVTIAIEPGDSLELRDTRCNMALLTKIASNGGAIVMPAALDALADQLDLSPTITTIQSYQPLWARWSLLWIFVTCLCLEWIIRKWTGLA
jgi:hypothetical protein